MLAGRDIYIIDLADTDRDRIRDIGEAVIRAGAHAAVYLGDPVLFFWPRGQQEAA